MFVQIVILYYALVFHSLSQYIPLLDLSTLGTQRHVQ